MNDGQKIELFIHFCVRPLNQTLSLRASEFLFKVKKREGNKLINIYIYTHYLASIHIQTRARTERISERRAVSNLREMSF